MCGERYRQLKLFISLTGDCFTSSHQSLGATAVDLGHESYKGLGWSGSPPNCAELAVTQLLGVSEMGDGPADALPIKNLEHLDQAKIGIAGTIKVEK